MKRVSASVAVWMLLAGSAGAEVPASHPWTGFYIGAGIGAGTVIQAQTLVDSLGPLFSDTYGATGHFAMVTAGYDFPLMQRYVAGVFFDFDLSRISNDSWSTLQPFDQKHAWSIGGRLGYLATPTTLWYGLGGYTQSSFDFFMVGSRDLRGFFVGGGVESRLVGNWSLRGEYRYTQFLTDTIDLCGCVWLDAETSAHAGRLLLIYRFGSGAATQP